MEELCTQSGGYGRFFCTLTLHYFGWWVGVVAVPAVFLDHHRCEAKLPTFAWLLYGAALVAMLTMAVLLELSVVQRLGLLKAGELLNICSERRWQLPLITTVLWKLDAYTDVVFIFIARDCGSSLWWASLATFVFGVVFVQLLFNMCFACTDCDHELPSSFGFILLDFKLVNAAVRHVLPFDPDASHLPVARPVTLRTTAHLIGIEKVMGDVAQVSIQVLFLRNSKLAHSFVVFSVLMGILHGSISLGQVLRECVQDEFQVQAQNLQLGTTLLPGTQLSTRGAPTTMLPAMQPAGVGASGGGSMASHPVGSVAGGGNGGNGAVRPTVLGRTNGGGRNGSYSAELSNPADRNAGRREPRDREPREQDLLL